MSLAISGVSPAVDLDAIRAHLNYDDTNHDDDVELQFFLDAAAAWMGTQVEDLEPLPVQMAVRELVRHWWETQRGPFAGPLDSDTEFRLGALGFAIPNRVRELIGPYLSTSTAAAPTGSFPDASPWPDPVNLAFL